jgi:lipopolysaccharide export system protein LptC
MKKLLILLLLINCSILYSQTNKNEKLQLHVTSSKNHRIYFDYGTETLNQYYEPYQFTGLL